MVIVDLSNFTMFKFYWVLRAPVMFFKVNLNE